MKHDNAWNLEVPNMSKTLRNCLMLLLCLTLFACLAPVAFANGSTVQDLQDAIDHHVASFTLTGDMTISSDSGDLVINASETELIVPSGKTLTVSGSGNGRGILECGTLTLGGTVVVDGGIFRVNEKLNVQQGAQVQVKGGFNLFPAADILPDHTDVISYPSGSGKTNLLFTPTNDDEFTAAVSDANNLADNFIADINIFTPVTLTGTYVLTHQTELRVNGGAGGSLTLGQDAELRYDKCGGNVFLSNNGSKDSHTVCTNNGKMIVNNISLDANCTFISSGILETGTLNVGGLVQINGGPFRVNNELVDGGGVVEVNADCFNLFPAGDILPDHTDVINHEDESYKTNLLFTPTDNASFASMVTDINSLGDCYVADVNINKAVELTGTHVLTHQTELRVNGGAGGSLTLGQDAELRYDKCGGNVFLSNNGSEVPHTVCTNSGRMFVNNIRLDGLCGFLSSGIMETNELTLGGLVQINGGIFRVNNKLVDGGGTIEVNADCFNAFPAGDIPGHEGVISYSDDSYVTTLLYRPTDDSSFAEMVKQINGLGDRYSADVGIVSNVELTGQHVLTHKTFIYVRSGDGGALRVAPGAKLKYNGCGGSVHFENNGKVSPGGVSYVGGDLYVNAITIQPGCKLVVRRSGKVSTGEAGIGGTLENGGFIELRQRGGGSDPRMIVTDTGTCYGDGAIGVMDPNDPDSYFSGVDLDRYKKVSDDAGTRYIPADLVLPLDLTSIESEAFADGTFESVCIPGAVTSIAEDAFGDRTGLTIYGEPNSYSRTFAEDKGFNFIRTA